MHNVAHLGNYRVGPPFLLQEMCNYVKACCKLPFLLKERRAAVAGKKLNDTIQQQCSEVNSQLKTIKSQTEHIKHKVNYIKTSNHCHPVLGIKCPHCLCSKTVVQSGCFRFDGPRW